MGLLNNETSSQNTEIAHEILKELTTPTKQNKYEKQKTKISNFIFFVNLSSFILSERRACLRVR
jgi:hypothetical protein